ncbi:MAG: hypothetical protein WBA74_06745, partial [Cyclobacteriaceae bacterium]
MKRVLILIITISFNFLICKAQQRATVEGINYLELQIKKSASDAVQIKNSSSYLIGKFGTPSTNNSYYFEMDEKNGSLLQYNNNDFYIMEDQFYSLDIKTNEFYVGLNGRYITVGDNINMVVAMYGNAFDFKTSSAIYIPLLYNDQGIDGAYLIIFFDENT